MSGLAFCLFGVPGSHINLGVGALRAATLGTLLQKEPDAQVTVFDDGWGVREGHAYVDGRPVPIALCGARNSRRFHRPEAYLNMRISAALGGLGNAGVTRIGAADAVLDVSGGDSFSDIYGPHRFRTVAWPKRLAVMRRRPLVFLPQTYGPFRDAAIREEAADLVRRSAMAWARDPDSFANLRELAGADFDPARHREGVDVAFALATRPPDEPGLTALLTWWSEASGPVVGVNVSGLMFQQAGEQFALKANGWAVVLRLCERLLTESGVRIVLVPHVRGGVGTDSDDEATERLRADLATRHGDRVTVVPPGLDPHQAKWVISRTDWFVGMRMHATIAALSTGVPVANIAYSLKSRGVFATVGQEEHVADARSLSDDELFDVLWRSWDGRDKARAELAVRAPAAAARAVAQMDEIVAVARAERARHTPTGRA
jgi:polysaccharide pyruvyl transferase WcaK-like protein